MPGVTWKNGRKRTSVRRYAREKRSSLGFRLPRRLQLALLQPRSLCVHLQPGSLTPCRILPESSRRLSTPRRALLEVKKSTLVTLQICLAVACFLFLACLALFVVQFRKLRAAQRGGFDAKSGPPADTSRMNQLLAVLQEEESSKIAKQKAAKEAAAKQSAAQQAASAAAAEAARVEAEPSRVRTARLCCSFAPC